MGYALWYFTPKIVAFATIFEMITYYGRNAENIR